MCAGRHGIRVVPPRIRPRADRDEAVAALRVGERPAGAVEVRVERRVVLVDGVPIAARGVRLPQLDQRARERPSVLVAQRAAHDDAFAERRGRVAARQVAGEGVDRLRRETRPGQLRGRLRQRHERLRRGALQGRKIGRLEVIRLRPRLGPAVQGGQCR
jgi:hypothetical protein